jgi:NAD(P)-dependent dehydrogenase (short-subunit alcohol dehydrogenase family)
VGRIVGFLDGGTRRRQKEAVHTFTDQTALITGAAGTLGKATALAFARAGAKLALLDIDRAALEKAFGGDGAAQLLLASDATDRTAAAAAVTAAAKRFGRIDILCNIAGGFRMGQRVDETDPAVWKLMLDLNVGTILNMAAAVVPRMLAQGGGRIVNVGAMGGMQGRAQMGAYAAAKSAVARLTESMAAELRERGINVNAVLPSIIDTPANRADMPKADPARWVAPEDLAQVILFLASPAARAVNGALLPVAGLS